MAASDSCVPDLCADATVALAPTHTRIAGAHSLQINAIASFLADSLTSSCVIFITALLHAHFATPQANTLALATIGGVLTATLLLKQISPKATTVSSRIARTAATLRASTISLLFVCAIDLTLHLHVLGAYSLLTFILLPALLMIERRLVARLHPSSASQHQLRNARTPRFTSAQRLLDITLSALLLLLLVPLLLLIALAIRVDSPGPSLFIQERVGRDAVPFRILKFRSMFITAPHYEASPTRSTDPRITRVGRILRRLSLDELPQLLNVLRGDMSLVGPRPEMPFLVARHRAVHLQRLSVKPGITGLWQLSSDRPRPIHENPRHDLHYIRHGSLFLDLAILVHTLFRASCGGI